MSTNSVLPGGNGQTGGISDVVSQDDLVRFAQIGGVLRWLAAPLEEAPPPTAPITLGSKLADNTFKNLYAQLRASGIPAPFAYLWASFWAAFMAMAGPVAAFVAMVLSLLMTPVAIGVLEGLGDLRQGIDPAVGILAQEVLTEFLGVEVGTQNLPLGIGGSDHLARAQAIGKLLHDQLETEFLAAAGGTVQPSTAPAQTFSGLAVNFGLASGIMGIIGGLVPEVHLEEMRELGEEVARNVGLGRLVRRALTPLIDTMVSKPAQWAMNTKYRPTQFKEADLVNPYLGTQLDHTQLYSAMHLLGYTDDKIQAFIEMHQKRLTPGDVALLVVNALWPQMDGEKYLDRAGWPTGMSGTLFALEDLHEQRGWYDKLIAELETSVKEGRISIDEFENVLRGTAVTSTIGTPEAGGATLPTRMGLPFSDGVKDVIMATVRYKAKAATHVRPEKLSNSELFYAFAAGLLTDSEVRDYWTARGLPAADQDIRMLLWLQHLNRLHELEKAKLTQYQEKQKVFLEKQGGQKAGPVPPIPPVPPFPLG